VRLSVAVENYNYQHQDLRNENGVEYGDTIDKMNFPYLARVTKLNVAALAWLASAPPPPEPTVEGAVSTDTKLTWGAANRAAGYVVHRRRTDANQWQIGDNGQASCQSVATGGAIYSDPNLVTCEAVLAHIRVDDWVFGVSSVSKDGFESPIASAVPGGAFKPWVKPAETAK
jgi:hypothetical protein